MNARKSNLNQGAPQPTTEPNHNLRVLSKSQRKKVKIITKDWKDFTRDVHAGMFDKI